MSVSPPAAGTAADPYASALGVTVLQAAEEAVRVELTIAGRHLNDRGIAHGGVLFSLADVALSVAANLDGRFALVPTATVHFLRPVREGDVLVATASAHHQGGTLGLYSVEIRGGGTTVARMLAQSFTLDR
ncbi:hotdog fold thioesterase [Streptomyces sp. NPDC051320]|uniref:PaaI family thioesterase n=1 Tax=Streptomyces sp. NPDC051320 TaxID=3154644 RepID=UPI0034287A97